MPSARRRLTALISLLLLVAWTGLWFETSNQFHEHLDAWIAAERVKGHDISFDDTHQGGSPFSVTKTYTNVRWKDGKGTNVRSDEVTLIERPWCWRSLEAVLHNAALARNASDVMTSETLDITILHPATPPKDHTETGLSLETEAKNISISAEHPLPFSDIIAHLKAKMRVMGLPPDIMEKASVASWNDESGVIEIDSLNLDWNPLALKAKGTLALDNDLSLEGAFSAAFGKRESVAKELVNKGWVALNDMDVLTTVLKIEKVSISFQEGMMFLGPVRIASFPPLTWH
jgi:hypothetical protein